MKGKHDEGAVKFGPEVGPDVHAVTRRHPDGTLEPVLFTPVVEGKPVPEGADLVFLGREDENGWRKVEGSFQNGAPRTGPPQVATSVYRDGYDRIFGKRKVGQA